MKPEAEADYREFVSVRLDQLGRFAYLLCRDWHRAEDAVQKALVRLYLHWDRTTITSPDAYVRRVIVNVVRQEARRHWFKRERSSYRVPEREHPDHGEAGIDRLTLLDALSRLPKGQRVAVVLRHWEDRSVEQTAEIMNCSTGTVKSQTARGLQALRGLLSASTPEKAAT